MAQNIPQHSFLTPELLDEVDRRIAQEKGIPLPARLAQPEGSQPDVAVTAASEAPTIGTEGLSGLTDSFLSAVVDVGYHTKDFFFGGEPADEDKSWLRRQHEGFTEQVTQASLANAIVHEVSQLGAGLVGAGKLMGPVKVLQDVKNAGAVGRGTYEVARGAVAGFFALDPHGERLSNLIEQYEPLRNPITQYLAADPDDTDLEGRFKNALEGIGMDLALAGILEGSLRAIKAFRGGDQEGAQAALREVEELQAQYNRDMANQQSFEDAYGGLADQQARDGVIDGPPSSSSSSSSPVEPAPQAAPESTGSRTADPACPA